MLKLYYTFNAVSSREFLLKILEQYCGVTEPVLVYNQRGKPYLQDNRVYFSLSHSQTLTAVAVSDKKVGLDVEKVKKDNHAHVLSRLSDAEKQEILTDKDFFKNWTAKESYIKYRGETLAALYYKLTFIKGKLFLKDQPVAVNLQNGELKNGEYIYSVCSETEENAQIIPVLL